MNIDYLADHITSLKVRYCEIDGQGRVHNSHYLNYFERGRVEMLRSFGISYKELEATGIMLVVKTMQIEFHSPAEFDEDLKLYTKLTHCYGARIHHEYRICREMGQQSDLPELVVSGRSSIACVDRSGKVKKLPKILQIFRGQKELDT